jgi:taurine dioxygenase
MLANTVEGDHHIPARKVRVPDDAPPDRYIRFTHPVVSTHRVTATQFLVPNVQQASHFPSLSMDESDSLLDQLFTHMYDEQYCYTHRWRTNDLLIWDNLTLQHSRPYLPSAVRRRMRRLVMTEVPMSEIVANTVFAMPSKETAG